MDLFREKHNPQAVWPISKGDRGCRLWGWQFLCCLVAKSWLTLLDPMNCSTPRFPVLHYFPQFAQTHVHWIGDAIQQSHPVTPSPFPFSLSQHQSFPMNWLFASGGQSIGVSASASISILTMKFRVWSPFRIDWLICLLAKRLSRVLSSTAVGKHHFFCSHPSLWSNSYIHSWLLEKA